MTVDFSKIPLLAEADIAVIGGGVAGCAAAIASAAKGAKTLIIEQGGAFGGLGTLGLGTMFAPRCDYAEQPKDLAEGIGSAVIKEMCRRANRLDNMGWVPVNTEILKKVLDDAIIESGAETLFQQRMIDAEVKNGRIAAIAVSGMNGIKKIAAKVFIDCTGDALLALAAGAKCFMGDKLGNVMSPTLCVQYSDVNYDEYMKCGRDSRLRWLDLANAGKAPLPERHYVGLKPCGTHTANGNLGHIYGLNPADEKSLTNGYFEGRSIAETFLKFHRENVPGFQNAELCGTAYMMGLRETRRVECDYWMTENDYRPNSSFDDEIGRYNYAIDIHSSTTSAEAQENVLKRLIKTQLKPGESYAIPYRALLVKGFENLMIAGRITSSDRAIQSSLRVMPGCFITGQAAGIGAALSIPEGGNIRSEKVFRNLLPELEKFKKEYCAKIFA